MEEPPKTEPIDLITDSGRGLISEPNQGDRQKSLNISPQSKPSPTPDLLKETPKTCYSFVERANFLSLLHFIFGLPFIYRTNKKKKKKLTMDDLGPIGLKESSEYLEGKFTQTFYEWRAKDPKKRRAIEIEILKFFKKDYAIQLFWQLVQGFARILVAFFLYHMLTDLRNPLGNPRDAYIPSIGLFLCNIVAFYAMHQAGFNVTYSANKLRAGLLAMVFRKITKLSPTAVHNLNLGKLINVMASDTNSLERAHIMTFVSAPLIFLGGFGMLYWFWGPSCLVGLGYMAASWILQFFLPFKTIGLRIKGKADGDERLKYMNDTIEAIRTIKVFGWEFRIIEKIEKTRDVEIKDVKQAAYLDCVPRAIVYTSHWIGGFLIYLVYTACVGPLSANKTFPTMIVMNVLRQFCMLQFFSVMGFFFEMKGFTIRIISILNLPEVEPPGDVLPCKDPENAIEFEDFTGYWMNRNLEANPPPPAPKLKLKGLKIQGLPVWKAPPNKVPIDEYSPAISHINLNIKKGSLTVVIGPIGSGKSSLLASLMGEMAHSEGALRYSGKYVYMGQNPTLGLGKIREIIVSPQEYDAEKFKRIVEACNLSFDLKNLPEGADTNMGERGIILNEGQKARIVLARMIYQDADIYLLDDPFGYMNWNSAKHIFHSAIQGLLRNKTVVLCTYRVYTLRFADQIVVMNKGEVSVKGTPQEIKASKVDINSLIGFKSDVPFVVVENNNKDVMPRSKQILEEVEEENIPLSEEAQDFVASRQDEGLILEDEKLDDGKVTWRTYWQYFRVLFNPFTFIILGVLFAAGEIYAWLYLYFLGKWARGLWSNHLSYAVVGPVVFSSIFVHILKYLMYFRLTLNASRKIHNKMLRTVYMAPITFFDKNPLGRIISRFAVDVGIVDRNVQASLLEILEGFTLFMVYLFSLWITEPWILVTAGSVFIIGVLFYMWCRKAVYESRGLELITRAPMYSLYSQAVDNLATIRARKLSDWLIRRFYSRVDDYSRANIHYMVSARVLRFWIDYVGELGVIVTICIFISANSHILAIGYFFNILISLTATMSWILRSFLTLDLFMSSVARVTTFIEKAKTVELVKLNDEKYLKEEGFPKRGDIEIRNAVMRYSTKSDPFVYNFNLNVKHGEKIAIVGGARSGFSNILAMLIRIFEIDRMPNSYITIDGVNTRDVGLQVLRKPFVIIPQEAYLITGSIRHNIDPWNEYTDEQIWEVLELVGLKEYIENLKNQLKTHISKGSSTFSMGQRQLFCMARSLLKKSALVLQDDMGAHVDLATAHEIQQRFLERYKDSTVLTMTHRVMTIALYDKVIIMSQGVVKEVGEPYLLLAKNVGDRRITNRETEFAGLISNLGKYISRLIFRMAMQSYYKKHGLELPEGNDHDDDGESHGESDEDRRIIPHGGGLKEDEIDPGMIRVREENSVMRDSDDFANDDDDVRRNEIQKDSVRQFNKFDSNEDSF